MGTVSISLDFELGWGAMETGLWRMREANGVYRNLRPIMTRMTGLLGDLELSLTWATVGAMISAPKPADFDHLPDAFRTRAVDFLAQSDALTHDGRDLFAMVAECATPQDIGSHTFSHTRFPAPEFSRAAKQHDLEMAVSAVENQTNQTPRSFVFPLNQPGDLDLVSEAGFEVARLAPEAPKSRVGKLMVKLRGAGPSAFRSAQTDTLSTETGSFLYTWGIHRDRHLRRALANRQLAQGLRWASTSDFHMHIWLHPFNLSEVEHLEDDFTALLRTLAIMRDAGSIRIEPMSTFENLPKDIHT